MYRIGQEEIDAVARVINSKKLFKINEANKETFHAEEEMCEYVKATHSLIMTSGHAGLVSALIAAGIGPGDQVIVPAYTYIASPMAVVAAGAIPVIAEINESLTIDPEDIERKITPYTKAIMPVHMLGMPCKMDRICDIAEKHGLIVIEDACQAFGATYNGRFLGTWGDAGAYSFNYFKIISSGEGGALVTDNKTIYQKALIYHDSSAVCFFGNQMAGVDVDPFCGNEYRTNEIQSAILREQMKRIEGIIADLHKSKKYIKDRIEDVFNVVETNDPVGELATHLQILIDTPEEARAFVERSGIGGLIIDTGKHVYTNWAGIIDKRGHINPLMDPFKFEANKGIVPDYKADMCPKTLDLLSRAVNIPMSPDITEAELDLIVEKLVSAK